MKKIFIMPLVVCCILVIGLFASTNSPSAASYNDADVISFEEGMASWSDEDMNSLLGYSSVSLDEWHEICNEIGTGTKVEFVSALVEADPNLEEVLLDVYGIAYTQEE